MRTATIRRILETGVEIHSPYEVSFVSELKVTVPHYARKWIPERKVWIVSSEYATTAIRLLSAYFKVIDLSDEETKKEHAYSSHAYNTNSHAVLHLLPSAPVELVKAAYRCLAMLYHPDRGGDVTKMQQLNRAYEELER